MKLPRRTSSPRFRAPDPKRPALANRAQLPDLFPPTPPGGIVFRVGSAYFDRDIPFGFSTEYTRVHLAVLGESGSGKSVFLGLLQRYRLLAGLGGMLVDPGNDLADDTLAFIAHRYKIGDEELAARCHVLSIDEDLRFRYDVFADLPSRSAVGLQRYIELLDARAERVQRTILRRLPGTEIEVMNRLLPRMKAVIMACGVDYDGKGTHLGLDKALELSNPDSPRFTYYLGLVFEHLPREQQDVFREIMAEKLTQGIRDRWESTQNRFRRALSPAVKLAVGAGPSLDLKRVVTNHQYVIVRARQSKRVPPDAASTMTGLLIDGVLAVKEAEEDVPPYLRVPFSLTIDEVGDYLSDGLVWSLCNDRKALLELTLAAQNYMRMCNDNVALGDYVLTQCGTVVCFAQRGRSADFVAERLFRGNESYTPRLQKIQRQYGWVAVQTPDISVSGNHTTGSGEAANWTLGTTDSTQKATQNGRVWNWAHSNNTSDSAGHVDTKGDSVGQGSSASVTQQPIIINGVIIGNAPVPSAGISSNAARQDSQADSVTHATGSSDMEGGAQTQVQSEGTGHAISRTQGGSTSANETDGSGWSLSIKTSLMPHYVWEWEWDGSYEEGSPDVQRAAFLRWLHVLNTAECFVSVRGCPYAFPVKIDPVRELWRSPELKFHATRFITRLIARQHDYTFAPEDVAAGDELTARAPAKLKSADQPHDRAEPGTAAAELFS